MRFTLGFGSHLLGILVCVSVRASVHRFGSQRPTLRMLLTCPSRFFFEAGLSSNAELTNWLGASGISPLPPDFEITGTLPRLAFQGVLEVQAQVLGLHSKHFTGRSLALTDIHVFQVT